MSTDPIPPGIYNFDRYCIRLTQTSKGVWYCERLEISDPTYGSLLPLTESIASEVNAMLKRINING